MSDLPLCAHIWNWMRFVILCARVGRLYRAALYKYFREARWMADAPSKVTLFRRVYVFESRASMDGLSSEICNVTALHRCSECGIALWNSTVSSGCATGRIRGGWSEMDTLLFELKALDWMIENKCLLRNVILKTWVIGWCLSSGYWIMAK